MPWVQHMVLLYHSPIYTKYDIERWAFAQTFNTGEKVGAPSAYLDYVAYMYYNVYLYYQIIIPGDLVSDIESKAA
jgi:hypothetical protein